MCTTCGCSMDARPRVTDLQTGEVAFLDEGVGHLHRRELDHEHGHSHEAWPFPDPRPHERLHEPRYSHEHGYPHDAYPMHAHLYDRGPDLGYGYRGSHEHEPEHDHGYRQSHEQSESRESRPRSSPPGSVIGLEQELLAKNDKLAAHNRGWFAGRDILAVNLMSSPGAGKTSLLERLLRDLNGEFPMSVVEGDQETLNDAERIRRTGCSVVQINTGTGCHLDAEMLARGLNQLSPVPGSVVWIENVGNLVCPALFDLGEACKVVIMSVTEGEDKPLKYPHMFRASRLMILNKIDLLPHVSFDVERCLAAARRVNPELECFQVSATRGDGLDALVDWLRARRAALRQPLLG